MIQWPYIYYQGQVIKFPDDTDVWQFLGWFDEKYYGITPEIIAQRRADEAAEAKQLAKGRKK